MPAAKLLQSYPTLCDSIDGSPLGSSVPGILQARTLEWIAISFSNAWKWKVKVKSFSCARLLATPWTAAYQAPPSMGFSRQDYWSGLSLPSPKMPINSLLFNLPLHIPMSHFISFYVVCLLTNYNIYICFYYSFPLIFILKWGVNTDCCIYILFFFFHVTN